MKRIFICVLLITQMFFGLVYAETCTDPRDTFSEYDEVASGKKRNVISSEYYVLSYSWAPQYCKQKVSNKDKKPGGRDYLQCKNDGREFGYILHGLWPQGKFDGEGGYPQYCAGEQNKIDRKILEEFLCMTPSVGLMQHEFEKHGTCMHEERLRAPQKYFGKAKELHSKLILPGDKLKYTTENVQWFVDNNKEVSLKPESIQYYQGGQEWQICYDNNFKLMCCPSNCPSNIGDTEVEGFSDEKCRVKGNISSNSGKKYYFLSRHPNYSEVVIVSAKGERCFPTEVEAIDAGWKKAPN